MKHFGIHSCEIVGDLAAIDLPTGERQLLRPIRYTWQDWRGLQSAEVPQGYCSDGASKPQFTQRVIGWAWGASKWGALIHDYAFTNRPVLSDGARVSFEYAAALYLCYLERTGVGWLQRNIEYAAVLTPMARALWNSHDKEFAT